MEINVVFFSRAMSDETPKAKEIRRFMKWYQVRNEENYMRIYFKNLLTLTLTILKTYDPIRICSTSPTPEWMSYMFISYIDV